MKKLIREEPARLVGILLAALALASAFGLNVTDEQSAAIVAFVSAVLALGGMEVVRGQVTPNQKVAARTDEGAGQ